MEGFAYTGFLKELRHRPETPVVYFLAVDDQCLPLNDIIGTRLSLTFLGEKRCIQCGRRSSKLFNHGYCYPCFTTLAECDLCIVKPHLCHYHLGTCRQPEFGESHCMTPHYVYLAVSSNVKVGLTRKNKAEARWIDQGAVRALPIAELPTRKAAGELEEALRAHMADKTDWRKMLSGNVPAVDLQEYRKRVEEWAPESFRPYFIEGEVQEFVYPVADAPQGKPKSLTFDKVQTVEGILTGIKGQYLLFDSFVFHVKKHAGYKVQIVLGERSRHASIY